MTFSAIIHKDEMKLGSLGTKHPDRSSTSTQDNASAHMDEASEALKLRRKTMEKSRNSRLAHFSTAVSEQLCHVMEMVGQCPNGLLATVESILKTILQHSLFWIQSFSGNHKPF